MQMIDLVMVLMIFRLMIIFMVVRAQFEYVGQCGEEE